MRLKFRWSFANLLLLILTVVLTTSCTKNDSQPIELYSVGYDDQTNPVIDNQVEIRFPALEKTQLRISGGDGNFAVTNSNENILMMTLIDNAIDITPLTIGNSVVTITDKSGNSYMLNVKVDYRTIGMIIEKQDIIVIGNKLSEVEKNEIREKAAMTLPVKINGGFKFIYNNREHSNQGQVFLYRDSYGVDAIESTFEESRMGIVVGGVENKIITFIMMIDGKPRNFNLTRYIDQTLKSSVNVPMALNEVLTTQFRTQYPNAEMVYTQQGFKTK